MEHYGIVFMGIIFLFNNQSSILKLNKHVYSPVNNFYSSINKPSLKHYPKNISSTFK